MRYKRTILSTLVTAGLVVAAPVPSATAATTGRNGMIAFTAPSPSRSDTDVWVMLPGGKGKRDFTKWSHRDDFAAAWSPEGGAHVAFVGAAHHRHGHGPGDIYRMDKDGTDVENLTRTRGVDEESPAWSAGGGKLLFSRSSHGGPADIYRMTWRGTDLTNLTKTANVDEREPAWSPDQLSVAFVVKQGDSYAIYKMRFTGSDRRKLASDARWPNWSPDGTKIVFVRDGNVWKMNADGRNKRQLTRSGRDSHPAWAPRQNRVVFQRGSTLVAMRPDGSHETRLRDRTGSGDPDWQPECTRRGGDGHDVIYGTRRNDLICFSKGGDTIYARGGDDVVFGGSGSDSIYGGSGDDLLQGGGSHATSGDHIYGGPGNDLVQGSMLGDWLSGGPGNDRLQGELGSDHLSDRDHSGGDILSGGPGRDYCHADSGDKLQLCP